MDLLKRHLDVLGCNLDKFAEDIEELTDGADKQKAIEAKMKEIDERWAGESFVFQDWKARRIPVLRATGAVRRCTQKRYRSCIALIAECTRPLQNE